MPDIRHGSPSAYNTHKCRCDECCAWKRTKDAAYYVRNQERIKARVLAAYRADPAAVQQRRRELESELSEGERQRLRRTKTGYAKTPEQRAKAYVRAKRYSQTPAGRLVHVAAAHRRRGVPLTAEAKAWVPILLLDPCAYCGGEAEEIDHILPVVDGGTGAWGNLAPACRSCNARKHSKDLLHFLLERRRE